MRIWMVAALLLTLAPEWAAAQVVRCTDAATGRVLYTDQPCAGGELVVPERTPEELQQEAERASSARERTLELKAQSIEQERDRLARKLAELQSRPPVSPAETEQCRKARDEAQRMASSSGNTTEEIRTARANAALACGQPPPEEVTLLPIQQYRRIYRMRHARADHDKWPRTSGRQGPGKRPPQADRGRCGGDGSVAGCRR